MLAGGSRAGRASAQVELVVLCTWGRDRGLGYQGERAKGMDDGLFRNCRFFLLVERVLSLGLGWISNPSEVWIEGLK